MEEKLTYFNEDSPISVDVDESGVNGQRLFWLSVIMQGLSDALSTSEQQPFIRRREEALSWFCADEGRGSNFAMVCDLADVDFLKTKKRIQMFIDREIPAVDFRCLRKGYTLTPESQKRSGYWSKPKRQEVSGVVPKRPVAPRYRISARGAERQPMAV